MSDTRTYTVTGMTCGHCVASVTEEVQEIPGVSDVDVDLETGAADRHQRASPSTTPPSRAAVEEAGYQLAREHPDEGRRLRSSGSPSVFGGALGIGNAVGAGRRRAADATTTITAPTTRTARRPRAAAPRPLRTSQAGCMVSAGRLHPAPRRHRRRAPGATYRRRVHDRPARTGTPVTAYDVEHEKQLHLIAVRRDLTGFQHVHPELDARRHLDHRARPARRAPWRVFADFKPTGADDAHPRRRPRGRPATTRPRHLPAEIRTAEVDGYTVTLDGRPRRPASRRRAHAVGVSKDGQPVTDLQPYLGAYGHLVALRAGDLAYLHVHPDGDPGDGKHRARARRGLLRRGAQRRRLPALPRLPARRRRPHRRVRVSGPHADATSHDDH